MPSSETPLPPDLQRDIRAGRPFSLGEAIGREGGSFIKGSQAMVPRPLRAVAAINGWIDHHVVDGEGALVICLKRWVKADVHLGQYLDEPLRTLGAMVADIAQQPQILYDFARQVAMESGKMNGERPYFQSPGADPHPEAAYSHESIRGVLLGVLDCLDRPGVDQPVVDQIDQVETRQDAETLG